MTALDGGRYLIEGALGESWVLPGVVDDEAVRVFLHGRCAALAVALLEETGWPLALVRPAAAIDGWSRDTATGELLHTGPRWWRHVTVCLPDGRAMDVLGPRSPLEVCSYWDEQDPGLAPHWFDVVSWEGFLAEVTSGSWGWGPGEEHLARSIADALLADLGC